MTAPLLARALIAAAAPPADYESIAGDLHEEYLERVAGEGRVRADLWYWSQALRSAPALLSYSRTNASWRRRLSTAAIAFGVLIAMLAGKDLLDRAIDAVSPIGLPAALYFTLDWLVAGVFGAILASLARGHAVRIALCASSVLVAAFAAPIVLGVSPQISLPAWLLLIGTIPAMSAGAGTARAFHHR